jgi:hypothetical protein
MKYKCLLIVSIGVALALAQVATAQSGRLKTPPPAPSPSPSSAQSVATTGTTEPTPTRPIARPSSIIISGKTHSDTGGYHSQDVRDASDEIKYLFELFRLPCKPVKGGTMTAEQARDRAKKETDAYVLWLGINVRLDQSSVESVMRGDVLDHVDYVLFRPGTGEIEYRGTVDPNKIVQTNEHGARLPPMTQGRSRDVNSQLRRCAFEIVRVVRGRL